jgi:alpha-L-rhamnosidase
MNYYLLNMKQATVALLCLLCLQLPAQNNKIAATPPLGWNSYTGYSTAAPEEELLKNIDAVSEKLKPYGYQYVTVDNGWFLTKRQDAGGTVITDEYGRPESSPFFFPNGVKSVINYAHQKGLKFGIWLIRGVDRKAVEKNLPIEGTKYKLQDIADKNKLCPWNDFNYGVDMSKPGAQEYYNSLVRKYAGWGVDFIKFDDIVPHPDEVQAVVKAIKNCGRDIVLSLSPGDYIKVEHSQAYKEANMVRITSDIWDNRESLETTFQRWEEMQKYDGSVNRSWLDMDMICFGQLYVVDNGGWQCKFTPGQKRTFMLQRAMAASPLIAGGVLYSMDNYSISLLTHADILACDQNGVVGKLAFRTDKTDVWKTTDNNDPDKGWIGIFNRDGKNPHTIQLNLKELGLDTASDYELKELWSQTDVQQADPVSFTIGSDDCIFLSYKKIKQQFFKKAQPVWPAGKQLEKNYTVGFRSAFERPASGTAMLRITGSTLYRIYLNGEFIGHGPARAGHGYYRVDEWDFSKKMVTGTNSLAIEVAGYNVNSYYLLDQPSFLQAEVASGENIIASTSAQSDDFEAIQLTGRIQKVPRYSFQRPFTEVYELEASWDAWRINQRLKAQGARLKGGEKAQGAGLKAQGAGLKAQGAGLKLERTGLKKLVPRRVSYPEFVVREPVMSIASGTMKTDVKRDKYWKDRAVLNIGPELGGFKESELAMNQAINLQEMEIADIQTKNEPVNGKSTFRLGPDQFRIFDFGTNLTGFIGTKIEVTKPGRLYLTFDEILTGNDVDFKRLGCINAVTYDLAPGIYSLESFEPYTARYVKVMMINGEGSLKNVSLREYANPDIGQATFESSDPRLNRIFQSGVETFRQNAVDIFMDCPHRERAGWLCDSYFTSRVANDVSGNTLIEKNFLENFLLPDSFAHLPKGMLPMCYPSDHNDGVFIPNWAMWFVVELKEYLKRSNDRVLVDQLKPKVMDLLKYFEPFKNSDGLLEKLDSWIFVEWSDANGFVQDVNYPTNMLFASTLEAAGEMYGIGSLINEAAAMRETIRKQSYNGSFFVDNAVRKLKLERTNNISEVCQYFAFYFKVASKETYPELWKKLATEFGPKRKENNPYPNVHFANSFVGNYLRLELLSENNLRSQLLGESIDFFDYMAEKTGTLWENISADASCDHGFASHVVHMLYRDVLGIADIDINRKVITLQFSDLTLASCKGAMPVGDGLVKLEWKRDGSNITYQYECPEGYKVVVKNNSTSKLLFKKSPDPAETNNGIRQGGHSHNDYEQKRPFFSAWESNLSSIEADIWAVGDQLIVAHGQKEVALGRSLDSLYLQPIVAKFKRNGNKAWKENNNSFILLIDLKTSYEPTLDMLIRKISAYPQVFNPAVNPRAVRVVVSGNTPPPSLFKNYSPIIGFDGRPGIEYTGEQLERIALISESLDKVCTLNGDKPLPEEELLKIEKVIRKVHKLGKPVRFWGAPDHPEAWDTFRLLGVDLINTDQPERFAEYLKHTPLNKPTELFRAGDSGYACFRIPAMVKSKKGTLLAFAEARKKGCSDTGDIDLVLRRSTDQGKTWSTLQVIWDDGENVAGNPAPVVDYETGTIILLSTWNLGTDHESMIIDQTSKDTRRIFIMQSADDGTTWNQPREITSMVKLPSWTWYATGPVHGIQLKSKPYKGRLMIPCDHIEAGTKKYFSHVIYSDDHGSTWKLGGTTPQDQVNECTVAELPDGKLMLNMRNYERKQRSRKVSSSMDGGATWSDLVNDPALIEPICQAALLDITINGRQKALAFLNPADSAGRRNLELKISRDEGKTWELMSTIQRGPAAYSDLVQVSKNELGCLYEAGKKSAYEGIYFNKVPISLKAVEVTNTTILDKAAFKHYADKFNEQDKQELHVDVVPGTKMIRNADAWPFMVANIPFFECPDKEIEEVYYYRWWTFRKHIKQTPEGYVITEFMPNVSWARKYNSISCPAMHHFREGRWLRNPDFIKDYGLFWLRQGGDPYVYSFPIAESFLQFQMVHPDKALLTDVLPDLVTNFHEWEKRRRSPDGLFWQNDGQDGMEVAIGGTGKRPTINSYMFADARAISIIATMAGKSELAGEFSAESEKIKQLTLDKLWDPKANFFKVIPTAGGGSKTEAPPESLSDARELLGYIPWYVELPPKNAGYETAWNQLMDPKGFYAPFGPTTAEQRHPGFRVSYEGHECQWNGPSWPFATSQTLTALANVLNDYPQTVITKDDFFETLKIYTKSHRFRQIPPDGVTIINENLWIDENLNPFNGDWLARTRMEIQNYNHGFQERGIYYNHSTYNDIIINGLVGLRPSLDNTLTVNPLIPDSWDWFCLDDIFYQGKRITILWDRNGTKYKKGIGFQVSVDGKVKAKSKKIMPVTLLLD